MAPENIRNVILRNVALTRLLRHKPMAEFLRDIHDGCDFNATCVMKGGPQKASDIFKSVFIDGLICHHVCEDVPNPMNAGARHRFMVSPGEWARALIELVDVKEIPTDKERFRRGEYGLVVEMGFSTFQGILSGVDVGSFYRLVRFT